MDRDRWKTRYERPKRDEQTSETEFSMLEQIVTAYQAKGKETNQMKWGSYDIGPLVKER